MRAAASDRRRSPRAGVLLLALATALAAPGCKSSESGGSAESADKGSEAGEGAAGAAKSAAKTEAKTEAVTLQLNWVPEPEFGGFYAAKHSGGYERAGLDVDIVAGGAGVPTWNMVAAGKVPFAIASGAEILRARLQDAPVVALYAVYQTNPQALMVHADSPVESLEEVFLSGAIERVIMVAGLPYVEHLKQKYGFDKVEIAQYGGNLSLFLPDKKAAQQCFIFSEPVTAREQGVEVKAFSVAESGFNPYLAVLITSEAHMKEHPEQVQAFVEATRAGWQMYLEDPKPTNEYMKQQGASMSMEAMNFAAELQTPYIVSDETSEHYLGYMSAERWSELAQQLLALEEIESIPDVTTLFHNAAAR